MTISEVPSENDPLVDVARPGVFSGPLPTPVPPPSARTLTEAHQTAAWRAPAATRFDGRPANDVLARAEAIRPTRIYRASPRPVLNVPAGWFTFTVGACVAALLGALLGGLLSV